MKQEMKKHIFWIGEFFLWGILIFSTLFTGLYIYNANVRKSHTYYVFFKDVDGLIKGSPVKMLGYQVGYVSDITPINDEMFVSFVITERKMVMPEKMTATVEFTGMGGSKSLELSVPKPNVHNKNFITTVEPKRIQDYFTYSTQTAQNIMIMSSNFLDMMTPSTTEWIKRFIKKPDAIHNMNKTLDDVQHYENKYMEWRK